MICPKCGAQVNENNAFCTSCGAAVNRVENNGDDEATVFAPPVFYQNAAQQPVQQAYAPAPQKPKKKSVAPIIIAVVAVLVVVGVVLGVVFGIVLPNMEDDDAGKKKKKRDEKETTTYAEIVQDNNYNDVLISVNDVQPMSKTISVGLYNVLAVNGDGTVSATGENRNGLLDVGGWRDIVAVSTGGSHTLGLKTDGTVVATGNNDQGECNVDGWTDIVSVSSGTVYSVGLKADGTVVATGRNDYGKCDVGGWTNIVAVSAGSVHTVGIRSDGTVVAVGDNSTGACDVGGWTDIIAVSLGYGHTIGLKADGTVVVAGNAGNGSSCDVGGWRDIVAISTNDRYTIGIRKDGTVVSTIRDTDKDDTADYTYLKNKLAQLRGVVAVSAPGIFGYDIAALKADGTVVLISMVIYWVENNIDQIDFEYDTSGWSGVKIIIPDRFRTPDNGGNKFPDSVVEVTVPVTEPVTEPATVIVTELVTEPSTTRPAQRPTQPTTQRPTQRPTQVPTQRPTQVPTQRPTQAPTQRPTQRPTQVPTTRVPVTEVTRIEEPSVTAGPSQRPTQPDVQLPSEKAEIVAYFNEAINGVKPNATKVIHAYSAVGTNGEAKIPAAIDTAMKVLGGAENFINDQIKKNITGTREYMGSDIKAIFPVEGEAYASKLTTDDVIRATAGWSADKKYVIVNIVTKSDARSANVKHGQGHAPKVFNVVTPDIVNDNVPDAIKNLLGGDAEIAYPECMVTVYVDPETGRVIQANYICNWTIYFGDDIVVPLNTVDCYLINY